MKNQTKNMDWEPIRIKRAIEDAGSSQTAIAKRLGKSVTAVNKTIWESMPSDEIRRAIAKVIGVDVSVIWPSVYLAKGGPRKRGEKISRVKDQDQDQAA